MKIQLYINSNPVELIESEWKESGVKNIKKTLNFLEEYKWSGYQNMKNDYYENLPKKYMGCGALFFNKKNELLIVKPSYRDEWSIPGGVVDENESPKSACFREIKEEIGLGVGSLEFLCVEYNSFKKEKGDSLQFTFYGGVLPDDQIKKIKIDQKEIVEYKFLELGFAVSLLNKKLRRRVIKSIEIIKNKKAVYLEDGERV